MKKITVTIPGHPSQTFPANTPASTIISSISHPSRENGIAVKFNGQLRDFNRVIEEDGVLELVDENSPEAHELLLHSTTHLMAQAVKELFPSTQITIGPALENRYYYDFACEHTFNDDDLIKIEEKMREIAAKNFEVKRKVVTVEIASKLFTQLNEQYKIEILKDIPENEEITIYTQGNFTDLCRGPHLPNTGMIKYFKLLSVSSAYWKNDEKYPSLQRIYGTSFFSKEALDNFLHQLEEAKKRDHRKLGKELDLFLFHPLSPGNPFFLPKGTIIYQELLQFLRELYLKYGYQEVISPQVFDIELWKQSGHWEMYRDFMYTIEINEREMGLKPMNCPGHTLIYSSTQRSYRELPVRLADFGRLHRYEKMGVVSGLTRVRSFSQDDAHIFCTPSQIRREIQSLLEMIQIIYNTFQFTKWKVEVSTKPPKALGNEHLWQEAEVILQNCLEEIHIPFSIAEGEGAFYGPKIDFFIKDAIGRNHQLGTIQLDFVLPERFQLTFVDEDGSYKQPVMIHRAILGSIERFIGVYLEHCGGDFPLWLAPVQVAILPVSEKSFEYSLEVFETLKRNNIRVWINLRSDKVGAKIRDAELQKINNMLIVGEKETNGKVVSLRQRFIGDIGKISVEDLVSQLTQEIQLRKGGSQLQT